VYLISLAEAPAGDGKASPCDIWAQPWGEQYFEAKVREAKPFSDELGLSSNIKPVVLRADGVEDKPMEFLCTDRIMLRVLTGLCGHPSSCKTWAALKIAADGSRGVDTFTGERITPFNTLYWTNETLPETIKRRFKAMGGDLKRLFILTGGVNADGKPVNLTLENVVELAQAVRESKAKLLVVDPLQSFIGAKVDMYRPNETRPLLDGLSMMAEREHLAVIVIRHLAKAKGTHAVTQALGSIDITAKMRTEYLVGEAQDGSRAKALVHVKPGEIQRQESLAFDIEGKNENARLVWKGNVSLTAQDLLAPEKTGGAQLRDAAKDFLFVELSKGPRDPKELESLGGFSRATLNRAAHELRVVMTGSKQASKREWSLQPRPKWRPQESKKAAKETLNPD
jgi:hypothetical protein